MDLKPVDNVQLIGSRATACSSYKRYELLEAMENPKVSWIFTYITTELVANSKDDHKVSTLLVKRAIVLEKMQRVDQARSDIRTALLKDANNEEAKEIFQRLLTGSTAANPADTAEKKSQNPRAAQFQNYFQQIASGNIPEIKKFVRSSGFVDVLAACGEQDADTESKSIAFMILTKIFNPPPNTEGYPMQTIIETCADCFSKCTDSGKNAQKLLAYRTLGAILETGMTVGASILSQEGVVEEMMDVIDFEILSVQIAMTDVLAIAASDKTCQKLIEKYASKWLAQTAKRSSDERLKASAGTALTKLQVQQRYQDNNISSSSTANDNTEDTLQNAMRQVDLGSSDLTDSLMKTIKTYKDHESSVILNAVEGLAYSTLQPDVKESVANDPILLKSLATLATDATNTNSNPLLFGIGTILSNTTMYKPVLDEQQKQMKRLRDLANAKSKGKSAQEEKEDERENNEAVDKRVKAIIEQGISPVLLILAKNSSSNLKTVAAQTYFNLVTPQATRGRLLQQGVTKGLLPLALAKDSTYSPVAAQALAKLAITADPRIAFGSQTSLELVPCFLELCKDTAQLRQFEGLMALTNLASVDDNVRFRIYSDQGMPIFENLQLSNNDMIQRAATEMICNMTFCPPVFEDYSKSPNRLRLLLILSDHEDIATRKAASGALAILANSKDTCERLANVDKAYERMVRLVDSNEPAEVQHRGIEIIRLMIENLGKEAADAFAKEQVNDMLVVIVTQSNVNVVRAAAMDVLKIFVKHGVAIKH